MPLAHTALHDISYSTKRTYIRIDSYREIHEYTDISVQTSWRSPNPVPYSLIMAAMVTLPISAVPICIVPLLISAAPSPSTYANLLLLRRCFPFPSSELPPPLFLPAPPNPQTSVICSSSWGLIQHQQAELQCSIFVCWPRPKFFFRVAALLRRSPSCNRSVRAVPVPV